MGLPGSSLWLWISIWVCFCFCFICGAHPVVLRAYSSLVPCSRITPGGAQEAIRHDRAWSWVSCIQGPLPTTVLSLLPIWLDLWVVICACSGWNKAAVPTGVQQGDVFRPTLLIHPIIVHVTEQRGPRPAVLLHTASPSHLTFVCYLIIVIRSPLLQRRQLGVRDDRWQEPPTRKGQR